MNLDFATLVTLRKTHPAWRLLIADHAPLIASFLNRVFIKPNVRVMARDELVAKLEDKLYHLREIARIASGDLDLLDDTALKDRFQQVSTLARELLSDFREVEHNFRRLDQEVREQIATWEGRKGALLEQIFGERDAIADSDQGKSFRAFWDFLMPPARQEELSTLLEKVFALPAVGALNADVRLKRIHYDWLEAGEHTQRTVAKLSRQLLQGIEAAALSVRDSMPAVRSWISTRPRPRYFCPWSGPSTPRPSNP